RRLIRETDAYLAAAVERLVEQLFFKKPEAWDEKEIAEGSAAYVKELPIFEAAAGAGPYLAGPLSAADLSLYPFVGMLKRFELRKPALGRPARRGPALTAWRERMEQPPFYKKCYPPHWKA